MKKDLVDKDLVEKAFLGILINDPDEIDIVRKLLSPDDMSLKCSCILYKHVVKLYDKKEPFDFISLIEYYSGSKGQDSNDEMVSFIEECNNLSISARDIRTYVNTIKTKSISKELQNLGTKLINKDIEPGEVATELIQVETELELIKEKAIAEAEIKPFSDVVAEAIDAIDEETSAPPALPTGIVDYDNLTGGFKTKRVYALGARPGNGKTTFFTTMAVNMARAGKRVSVFSIEMANVEIMKRIISRTAKINNEYMENPKLMSEKDWELVNKSAAEISGYDIFLHDDIYDLAQIELQCLKDRPDVIIIDYIQILTMNYRKAKSRVEELNLASRDLKILSKKLDACVIVGSQIGREQAKAEREPKLEDFKGSGGIEENSDLCMFLHWPYKMNQDANPETGFPYQGDEKKMMYLILAKNRHGPTGRIKVKFDYEYYKFGDWGFRSAV